MKILKRLGIAVIALVIILVIAGFVASKIVSKSFVEQQVSQATGRKLVIEGDLSPIISLSPSVRAEKVSFANASWGTRPQLATIGKFDIQMKLLPLLHGEVVVGKLEIDSADILLEKKGDTWNFSLADQAQKAEQKDIKTTKSEGTDKSQMNFDLSALSITNSKLAINQGGAPTVVNIKSLKFAPRKDKMGLDFEGDANGTPLKLSVDTSPLAQIASSKKLDMNSLTFESGQIKINGNVAVDLNGKRPYVKGEITADNLDFTSSKSATTAAPAAESKSSSASSADKPLPLSGLSSVDADLTINIASIKSGNILVEKISAPIKIKDGTLTASPLRAQFANGDIDSTIRASQGGAAVKIIGKGLSMEKILSEVAGINEFKNGPTTADIDVNGSGDSVLKIENSLAGHTNVYMKDGTYEGHIPMGSVSELSNLLTGGSSGKNTPVNCVLANIDWAGGVGTVKALAVDSQYASLTGTGTIKLATMYLDLVITPSSKTTSLMSLAVPVAVNGPVSNLSFYPEPKAAVQTVARNLLMSPLNTAGIKLPTAVSGALGADAAASPCSGTLKNSTNASAVSGNGAAPAAQPAAKASPAAKLTNKLGGLFGK